MYLYTYLCTYIYINSCILSLWTISRFTSLGYPSSNWNQHLRSEKAGRLMLGKEQLHVLGFPCWTKGASAARIEPWFAKQNINDDCTHVSQSDIFYSDIQLVAVCSTSLLWGYCERWLPQWVGTSIDLWQWHELALCWICFADDCFVRGRPHAVDQSKLMRCFLRCNIISNSAGTGLACTRLTSDLMRKTFDSTKFMLSFSSW